MEKSGPSEGQLNHEVSSGNAYPENEFANKILNTIRSIHFGDNCKIVPVVSHEIISQIKRTEIGGDYRAKAEAENGIASVFDGLAFDPEKIRSQSFAFYEGENPVGLMSAVIAPRPWIAEQRYFKREEGKGIRVVDAHTISGEELPEFYIIPAWTKVLDSHRGKFAIPGFNAFKKVMQEIEGSSPTDTWMQVIAQGKLPFDKRENAIELSKREIGTLIPLEEFPFDPE
ncbi:MAG: hypothetical protein M1450_00920 [Patescibacteria group bacterium]|nr:hypothetical protein [Patescibacteria group bacterium]